METIIDRIAGAAGHYEGEGDGVESGPFSAVVDVSSLLDGMGAEITYTATAPDGTVLHTEHTVLAFDMWSGEPCLHVLCAELSGMAKLSLVGASTFSNGLGVDGFELQIDLVVGEGTLEYVWSWGPPGEAIVERSRATTRSTG
ncbi:MAG: hypothetical protein WBP59_03060 [Ilumatobacteraceae bacterium]